MVVLRAIPSVLGALVWAAIVLALYRYSGVQVMRVPFLPIATVGTAVAFYVGFKNNSAYDRFWEARKIWGGVVNTSRTWSNAVLTFVYEADDDDAERSVLIRRHLAWINALRIQLRTRSRYHEWRDRRREKFEWIKTVEDNLRQDFDSEVGQFLSPEDLAEIDGASNRATQLLRLQAEHLRRLFDNKQLDLFKQLDLMKLIEEMYALQGKCERIKATPFPRQYAYYARLFVWVFVALVPCGLLDVFADALANADPFASARMPALAMMFSSALVTWVFVTMEVVGDFSEDPFEGSVADVPMNAMCRTIEIDVKQMLGSDDLPEPEKPLFGTVLY